MVLQLLLRSVHGGMERNAHVQKGLWGKTRGLHQDTMAGFVAEKTTLVWQVTAVLLDTGFACKGDVGRLSAELASFLGTAHICCD